MSFDEWEECRQHLETFEDEQLIADWDEAVRRDRANPDEMARLQLWDSVALGSIGTSDDRNTKENRVKRPSIPSVARWQRSASARASANELLLKLQASRETQLPVSNETYGT